MFRVFFKASPINIFILTLEKKIFSQVEHFQTSFLLAKQKNIIMHIQASFNFNPKDLLISIHACILIFTLIQICKSIVTIYVILCTSPISHKHCCSVSLCKTYSSVVSSAFIMLLFCCSGTNLSFSCTRDLSVKPESILECR